MPEHFTDQVVLLLVHLNHYWVDYRYVVQVVDRAAALVADRVVVRVAYRIVCLPIQHHLNPHHHRRRHLRLLPLDRIRLLVVLLPIVQVQMIIVAVHLLLVLHFHHHPHHLPTGAVVDTVTIIIIIRTGRRVHRLLVVDRMLVVVLVIQIPVLHPMATTLPVIAIHL